MQGSHEVLHRRNAVSDRDHRAQPHQAHLHEARCAQQTLPNIPFDSEPLINGHKDYANLGMSQRKAMLAYFSSFVRKLPISYTTFAYRRSEFADLDKLAERMRRDISEERCADAAWPCGTRPA